MLGIEAGGTVSACLRELRPSPSLQQGCAPTDQGAESQPSPSTCCVPLAWAVRRQAVAQGELPEPAPPGVGGVDVGAVGLQCAAQCPMRYEIKDGAVAQSNGDGIATS